MQRIAAFIVKFHTAIFIVFMALAVVCSFMAINVQVNTDMTKYLPATMQMKQGSTIMEEQFGEATLIELMVTGPDSAEERKSFADDLEKFQDIDSVAYEDDSARYNNGAYTHYTLTCNDGTYSDTVTRACNEAQGACAVRGYECWIDTEALGSATNNLTIVLVFAVIIAMIILFVLAASWLEPLLLLFTILIAVLINLGTNLIFGTVSDVTYACGAILQMALSMDYLIMLLNRYRKEHSAGVEPTVAMERAIAGGISAIASSSITTVAGLLCLVLMSFTIGRDMGLALAKGVFLSLVCAFAIMPALVLWFDDAMARTAKPTPYPKMKLLSAFSFKFRYVVVGIFVVLLVAGLAGKSLSNPAFTTPSKNPDHDVIAEQFDIEQQIVVLYEAQDEALSEQISKAIDGMEGITSTSCYATTLGKQYKAAKMADETEMDAPLIRMMYYYNFNNGNTGKISGSQLADYVRNNMADDLGDMLDESTADKLDQFANIIESELSSSTLYSADQAYKALSSHPSIHKGMVKLIYLAHDANTHYNKKWTMSTEELMNLLCDKILKDEAFDEVIDEDKRADIIDARQTMQDGKDKLVNSDYGRIICTATFGETSTEMSNLCTEIRQLLDTKLTGEYWLVGKGPMVQEMTETFNDEFNFISWVTAGVIFLIVLVTFRSIVIPAILVTVIQTAFNWDLLVNGLVGSPIYYVALIVVQSILMGATIDYAILFTTNYREARLTSDVRESVGFAYRNSIRTICMSGSILVFVCLILGLTAGGVTGQICLVISEGATASVILVLLVLPGLLCALDRLVVGRINRKNRPQG